MAFHKFLALAALAVGAATTSIGHAATITFDDAAALTNDGLPYFTAIQQDYAGLNWQNFSVLNTRNDTATGQSGYVFGLISAPYVAFNLGADPASFSSEAPIVLESAHFTAAWRHGLIIDVIGYVGEDAVYSKSFQVRADAPTLVEFNWIGVDMVAFSSFGGQDAGYAGAGAHFAMDDLRVSLVPELSTQMMFLLAVPMMAWRLRRGRRSAHQG